MPDHHGFTRKRFQPRDIALLWSKAGALCSHPECHQQLLAEELATDPAQTLGEMAHIVGHSPDGPRGDAQFPRGQIDLYENLILLCAHHHTLIDKQWRSFPVELLFRWKNEHEADISRRLKKENPDNATPVSTMTIPVKASMGSSQRTSWEAMIHRVIELEPLVGGYSGRRQRFWVECVTEVDVKVRKESSSQSIVLPLDDLSVPWELTSPAPKARLKVGELRLNEAGDRWEYFPERSDFR